MCLSLAFFSPSTLKSAWGHGHIGSLTSVGAALAALLVLSGCGGGSYYYHYSKPGVSQQQRAQDNFECTQASRQSSMVGSGRMVVGGTNSNPDEWRECLQARGYTVSVKSEEQRQAERQELMTERRALIGQQRMFEEQKRELDEQKRVLEEQQAALSGGGDRQQYEQAVSVHNQVVADFNQRHADWEKRSLDYGKRVADFNQQ